MKYILKKSNSNKASTAGVKLFNEEGDYIATFGSDYEFSNFILNIKAKIDIKIQEG